jgi:hypothetical protein
LVHSASFDVIMRRSLMDARRFCAIVATDPELFARYLDDPAGLARERNLSEGRLRVLLGGDREQIGGMLHFEAVLGDLDRGGPGLKVSALQLNFPTPLANAVFPQTPLPPPPPFPPPPPPMIDPLPPPPPLLYPPPPPLLINPPPPPPFKGPPGKGAGPGPEDAS